MKKNGFIIFAVFFLASCGGGSTSSTPAKSSPTSLSSSSGVTSSSTIASSSETTSSSSVSSSSSLSSSASSSSSSTNEADFYVKAMENTPDYYTLSATTSVKKGTSTLQNSYASKSIDLTNKIEHIYKRVNTLAGYASNNDSLTEETDTYQSATLLYEKGYDGKYHVSEVARNDFAAYHLSFDFSKLTDASVQYDGYDAILTAKVSSENLAAFGETSLSGVTDFLVKATLDKKEGILASFVFSYTQESYAVSVSYKFSSFTTTIVLPTV